MPAITEAVFRAAILPFTLHYEGGFSVDPHDPGNFTGGKVGKGQLRGTKYGISAAAHPTLAIESLTLEQACAIYWAEYFVKPGFTRLDTAMALVAFDAGVNCGPGHAAEWLKAAEAHSAIKDQIAAFSAANLAYHKRLKTWTRYGKAWGTRIASCEKQALVIAAAKPVIVPAPHPAPKPETPRPAPKAATQPPAGFWSRLLRVLIDALFAPIHKGVPRHGN